MACMAVASFLQSAGSLCVKLSDGRIPVFQIVVRILSFLMTNATCIIHSQDCLIEPSAICLRL